MKSPVTLRFLLLLPFLLFLFQDLITIYVAASVDAPAPAPLPPQPSSPGNGGNSTPPPPDQKGSKKGMNGGQKAGVAIGVLAAAGVVGFAGMVYKKRRHNIRRARFGSAARRPAL